MSRFEWLPDRRRNARVDLLVDVQGHVVTLDEDVAIRQVGRGGMTIETTAPLSPRIDHDFRLASSDRSVVLRGRVVHSRVNIDRDRVTYIAGVQFIDPPEAALATIDSFLGDQAESDPED